MQRWPVWRRGSKALPGHLQIAAFLWDKRRGGRVADGFKPQNRWGGAFQMRSSPLVEPDLQVSRIQLSLKTSSEALAWKFDMQELQARPFKMSIGWADAPPLPT
jgi:hypothetical protein